MENQETIEIELPKNFMNIGITLENYLIADTNDSSNWDTLKFPLPSGNWNVYKTENKKVILINKISPIVPPESYWD